MASKRCGCASDSCACVVTGGTGVDVSGSGTKTNPYVVDANLAVPSLDVQDEAVLVRAGVTSLNFTGSGITASPGASGQVVVNVPSSTGVTGITTAVQTFTANGTWTKPADLLWATVELVGGGGGSGGIAATDGTQNSASGGGAAGGYSRRTMSADLLLGSVVVTVGLAGAGGTAAPTAGLAGGASSFGAYCSAGGGNGGQAGAAYGPGAYIWTNPVIGGDGSGGDINISGGVSTVGIIANGHALMTAFGTSSQLSGINTTSMNSPGAPGMLYGGGAAGGANNVSQAAKPGGYGGQGIVIVTSYIKV